MHKRIGRGETGLEKTEKGWGVRRTGEGEGERERKRAMDARKRQVVEAPSIEDVIRPKDVVVVAPVGDGPTKTEVKMRKEEEAMNAEAASLRRSAPKQLANKTKEGKEEKMKDWIKLEEKPGLTWVGWVPLVITPIPSLKSIMRPLRNKLKQEDNDA